MSASSGASSRRVNLSVTVPSNGEYIQLVTQVSAYVWGLCNTNAPTISGAPSWYGKFQTDLTTAQKHALVWTKDYTQGTDLGSWLIYVPWEFVAQQQGVDYLANNAAHALENDDYDALAAAVTALSPIIQQQGTLVNSVYSRLQLFNSSLITDENALAGDASQAWSAVTKDQAEIDNLLAQITQVKTDIFFQSLDVVKDAFDLSKDIVEVGVGLVEMALAPEVEPLDVAEVITGVVETVGDGITTINDTEQLISDVENVQQLYGKLSTVEQDLVVVQQIANQFSQLADSGREAEAAMGQIMLLWNQVETIMNTITSDLHNISVSHFDELRSLWDSLAIYAKPLSAKVSSPKFNYSQSTQKIG